MVNRADLQKSLDTLLEKAYLDGKKEVNITSGAVHSLAGDYPGKDHRMPICCDVMRSIIRENDVIIYQPPKGKGASLTILYKLPR